MRNESQQSFELGQGFYLAGNQLKSNPTHLNGIDTLARKKDTVSVPADIPSEEKLIGQVTKVNESPSHVKSHAVDSLAELHHLVSMSFNLSAKLPELGLDLKASSSKEKRVDTRFLYYLIVIQAAEYALKSTSVPPLNKLAKQRLGLLTPDVETKQTQVDQAQKVLDVAKTAVVSAKAAKDKAEAELKLAEATLNEKSLNVQTIKTLYKKNPEDEKMKATLEAAEFEETRVDLIVAQKKEPLNQAKQILIEKDEAVEQAQEALVEAKSALAAAQQGAEAAIDENNLQKFSKYYGTHYINKVYYGRQMIALITVNRKKISQTNAFSFTAGAATHGVEFGTEFKDSLTQLDDKYVSSIRIAADGIKTTVVDHVVTMGELQKAINSFYDTKQHLDDPAPIDFTVKSYRDVFDTIKLPEEMSNTFENKTEQSFHLWEKLQEQLSRVLKIYNMRYLHNIQAVTLSNELRLDQDPHNVRLQYLFNVSKAYIEFLKAKIALVEKTPFHEEIADYAITNAIVQIGLIEKEMNEHGIYRLQFVNYHQFPQNTRNYPRTELPVIDFSGSTHQIKLSAVDANAQQQANLIPLGGSVEGGRPANLVNTLSNESSQVLGWIPQHNFTVRLSRERSTWGKMKHLFHDEEIIVADEKLKNRSTAVSKKVLKHPDKLYLEKGAAIDRNATAQNSYDSTVRLFTVLPPQVKATDEIGRQVETVIANKFFAPQQKQSQGQAQVQQRIEQQAPQN